MKLFYLLLFLFATWLFAPGPVHGQGIYIGFEVGHNFVPGIDITGDSNDRASVCDEYINPLYATVTQTAGYEDYNCTGPNRGLGDDWNNSFDGARGFMSGFVLGYRTGMNNPDGMRIRFRPEFEYFYRSSRYDQTSDVPFASGASGDKIRQEIRMATDRIGSLVGHHLFGNLYVDFTNRSHFTPYAGFGMGIGSAKMEYTSVWSRNADPTAISTGIRPSCIGGTWTLSTKRSSIQKTRSDQPKSDHRFCERRSTPITPSLSQALRVQNWTRALYRRQSEHYTSHTRATFTPHRRTSWNCTEGFPIGSSST